MPILDNRKTCAGAGAGAGCATKVSSPDKLCNRCRCATKQCSGKNAANETYCQKCIEDYKEKCCFCKKNQAKIPFRTCTECHANAPNCQACKKRKAMIYDKKTSPMTFFLYCFECKCQAKDGCVNPRIVDEHSKQKKVLPCIECQKILCIACKEYVVQDNSDYCVNCPKCMNEDCKRKTDNNPNTGENFDYCSKCKCNAQLECGNLKMTNNKFCSKCACQECFLFVAQKGTDVCVRCSPKCENEGCENIVGFSQDAGAFFKYCKQCTCRCGKLALPSSQFCTDCSKCEAENCSNEPQARSRWCARCNKEYETNRIKCPVFSCKIYCAEAEGKCKAHLSR